MTALTQNHNDTLRSGNGATVGHRIIAYFVAITATLTPIVISTIAAVYRGGTVVEKAAWIMTGVVLLLCAHFVPAMSKPLRAPARAAALLFRMLCIVATAYGHATFFLLAQDHARQRRVSTIKDLKSDAPRQSYEKDPAKIASDKAAVQRELAWLDTQHGLADCRRSNCRRVASTARLDALNVEFSQSERQQRIEDIIAMERSKVVAARVATAADPVTVRLARTPGVDIGSINLCLAAVLGLTDEGLGSFSWVIALAAPELGTRAQHEPRKIALAPEVGTVEPVVIAEYACHGGIESQGDCAAQSSTQIAQALEGNEQVTFRHYSAAPE